MDSYGLSSFWASLFPKDFADNSSDALVNVNDIEEKAITLLSRVLFLTSMSVKYEKKEIEKNFIDLYSQMSKILQDNVHNQCSVCSKLNSQLKKFSPLCSPLKKHSSRKSDTEKFITSPIKQKKTSISPKNQMKIDTKPEVIYAPETQINTDDIPSGFQQKKMKGETMIIPETLDPNTISLKYEDVDIFNDATLNSPSLIESNKDISPQLPDKHSVVSDYCDIVSPDMSPSLLGGQSKLAVKLELLSPENKDSKNNFGKKAKVNLKKTKSEITVTPKSTKFPRPMSMLPTNIEWTSKKSVKEKNLKQTKLTPDSFSRKKINIAEVTDGAIASSSKLSDKEIEKRNDYLLQLGLQRSLSTEDNKSFGEGLYLSPKGTKRKKLQNSSPAAKSTNDETPKKVANTSPIKNFEYSVKTNAKKSLKMPNVESPSKSPKLQKIQKTPPQRISKEGVKSSTSELRLDKSKLNEDEVLEALEEDSQSFHFTKPLLFKRRKIVKSPYKEQQNSFDIAPLKNSPELEFAYKENVVRQKHQRMQLEGWACHECRDYYEHQNITEEEKKIIMNRCSRHRSKYKAVTNTPEGFWNPDWEDTKVDEDDADFKNT